MGVEGIQTSRPTHALHYWSQGLLAACGSVPASSSWHRRLSVPGNTDAHIRLHLHNPAVDWSQFNGGWQSISITMFHPSTCQHQHRSVMTSGEAHTHSLTQSSSHKKGGGRWGGEAISASAALGFFCYFFKDVKCRLNFLTTSAASRAAEVSAAPHRRYHPNRGSPGSLHPLSDSAFYNGRN